VGGVGGVVGVEKRTDELRRDEKSEEVMRWWRNERNGGSRDEKPSTLSVTAHHRHNHHTRLAPTGALIGCQQVIIITHAFYCELIGISATDFDRVYVVRIHVKRLQPTRSTPTAHHNHHHPSQIIIHNNQSAIKQSTTEPIFHQPTR
jgi:hypothetical protein